MIGKVHFCYVGTLHTLCGLRGIWIIPTVHPENVTCQSCGRILGKDVKARIAKQYWKVGQDSRIQPDSLKFKRIINRGPRGEYAQDAYDDALAMEEVDE